ncbi:MAG: NAD(P)H-dependent oxidoreductase subunit E [Gammaproteobacteria bacterium]|nr:MAG: NAD(P)H-dependent oxidoreductase subunit E [Gammaproteobacteria bacterium]
MTTKCSGAVAKKGFKELSTYISTLNIGDDAQKNRAYLIQVLHKAQEIFGYLPEEVQKVVAKKLNIHLAEVYGVVSFYSFFNLEPKGKYRISVCTGTACYVKGAMGILDVLTEELGIKDGETSADGKWSLDSLRCIGACGLAPVMLINDKTYGNVTPDQTREILAKVEQELGEENV